MNSKKFLPVVLGLGLGIAIFAGFVKMLSYPPLPNKEDSKPVEHIGFIQYEKVRNVYDGIPKNLGLSFKINKKITDWDIIKVQTKVSLDGFFLEDISPTVVWHKEEWEPDVRYVFLKDLKQEARRYVVRVWFKIKLTNCDDIQKWLKESIITESF